MTVFNAFMKVIKKYIGSIIMYTCIFLSIAISSSKNNTNNTIENFKSTRLDIVCFNHSNSMLADNLIQYLSDNHNIKSGINEDINSIRDAIYNRDADYILIIPEDFASTHNVSAYKLPGSFAAEFMDMSIENFINTYLAFSSMGIDDENAYENTLKTVSISTDVSIADTGNTSVYGDEHYFYNYIPYVLICAIVTSVAPALISFNKKEVEKRTLCSGLSIAKRNYQMAKGCFLVAFGIIALYFITSCILYKGAMFTAAGALRLANTVVYALICLAITFFLSSFVKNNNTVNIFVNAFGLGSAFICGVFVPRQFLADGVIAAGRFFPAYWYVNNEEAASNLSAASASSIVLNFTIQLMFALAFMVLAIVISSKKKDRN